MRRAKGKAITEQDRAEIERFAVFLRLSSQAVAAGVPRDEAARAVYPDVYADENDDLTRLARSVGK